ncbi:N-acetyltransferase family protein [Streptomyces misionensis]
MTLVALESDHGAVSAMHGRTSPQSRYDRYQSARPGLSSADWSSLVRPDRGVSWVTRPSADPGTVVAVSHLMHTATAGVGELGLLVEDGWQNAGLGSCLVRHALARADLLGLRAVAVMTGRSNHRMLAICRALGFRTVDADGDTVDLLLPIGDDALPQVPGPRRPGGAMRRQQRPRHGQECDHKGSTRVGDPGTAWPAR